MKLSQTQFDRLEESTKRTFLDKQLWIKENFEVGRSQFFLLLLPSYSLLLGYSWYVFSVFGLTYFMDKAPAPSSKGSWC